ncbi:TPA: hypothetical protein DIV48_00895 [Candidatus Kaiserbacteria bacterium]|nr:MAG: hypothetical protein UY93_C0004G0031 [Parcubacteria group bacterium GW2011_GWA1_56_13]KKW47041.1 MAG: hypothetical protein UY97_C0001G0098 [Parcubacteria group bacterium GW2011_GWB1_57_6]HCR52188.1 hypothetical protein [Candidatus Kaiserbacteria bacterium]
MDAITLTRVYSLKSMEDMLRHITFRGAYNVRGSHVFPYQHAKFSLTTVYPQSSPGTSPEVKIGRRREPLFTPQPTIYENQTKILEEVDEFLLGHDMKMSELKHAVEYAWEGRGEFHILPPVIEKHTYRLKNGYLDLAHLLKRFKGVYVKDAIGKLHPLSSRNLRSFYIDEVSKMDHLDIFNSNVPIINYGLGHDGEFTFYIVCDGAHRLDYVLEKIKRPITALLVEPAKKGSTLYPYYAFPVPFRPTLRLSSKKSEKMYHRLERDKIHLLNDFIKKTLHYDWEAGGLKVSKLRTNVEIF